MILTAIIWMLSEYQWTTLSISTPGLIVQLDETIYGTVERKN